MCQALYSSGDWEGLARRWLLQRPDDWVTDVAAYIEGHSPTERHFETVRPPSAWLPADLVDPDPSDWIDR